MENNPGSVSTPLETLKKELKERPMRESLEPVRKEVRRLVEDDFTGTVVQVVGSNGKGSLVHYTNKLVQFTNQTVVSFTSPHVERAGERIRLNGDPLSDDEMNQLLSGLSPNVQDEFTPFERLLIAAITLATRQEAEILLLEAGMGGRWDATSALPADITVLTSVDLEHTEYLGETKLQILKEQTTQIPDNSMLIAPELDEPELTKRMRSIVDNRNLTRIQLNPEQTPDETNRRLSLMLGRLITDTESSVLYHQLESSTSPPGRQDLVTIGDRRVLFDVAHTPAAIREWIRRSRTESNETEVVFILGLLKGKNVNAITQILQDQVGPDQIILTKPPSKRALDPKTIRSYWDTDRIPMIETNPLEALEKAFRISSDGLVAVSGSFTLIRYYKNNMDQYQ
jgi:dihydrofolate synthase/folylpolyglutamate synthase